MRYDQTTAPIGLPIDFDDVLTHLGVVDELAYTAVREDILTAMAVIEKRTSRQLLTATWKLYLDAFPDEIRLERLPVAGVTSIAYLDTDGAAQTLSSSLYQVDCVSPNRPARIRPVSGQTWPATKGQMNAVTVTFTAGYGAAADVPPTFKHAIRLLVDHYREHHGVLNAGNIVNELPEGLAAILATEDWGFYG